jgi:hypothetical protein
MDDLGLLYLPGYDVKAKFFYGIESKQLVDYDFKQRTPFDEMLLRRLHYREMRRRMMRFTMSVLPDGIKRNLGKATVSHGK